MAIGRNEILVILGVFVLLFVLPKIPSWIGGHLRPGYLRFRWIAGSLMGTEDSAIAAEEDFGAWLMESHLPKVTPSELVERIGSRLSRACGSRRRWRFHVIGHREVNAFAAPGGHVVLTSALLAETGNQEDCIAFVLAHEMGHVELGHSLTRETMTWFVCLFRWHFIQRILLNAGSQSDEFAADEYALGLMKKAGCGLQGAIRLMEILDRLPHSGDVPEWWSTHPEAKSRIEAMREKIRRLR